MRGLHETADEDKPAVITCVVDPDFGETENVPQRKERRIGAFLDREVVLHGADGCY